MRSLKKKEKNKIGLWEYRIDESGGKTISRTPVFFPAVRRRIGTQYDQSFYGLLNPSFELAVEDGIIRKNPVTGTLGDYGAPAKEKEALTLEQQEKLLKFVEQSNVYKPHLPMMQVMFGACL